MTNPIEYFFTPRGVALIGASSNPGKLSYGVLENMTGLGYQGKVYPVNLKGGEILGIQCYSDVSEVPDPVDLAVIMIPAPYVPATIRACGERGIRAVTIISGGFKEVGSEGTDLEDECVRISREFGMRLMGPNCVGTMDLYNNLNTTFIRGVPDKGHIGFISQSGAVLGAVVDFVQGKGVGFSHFVSMGNEADVNETDLIEFLMDEPNVKVIAAYIEAIQDGQRFIQVAEKASRVKPIVMLKAGRSEAGERAVSSHTGSLAGSYSAYQAAFNQAGVIEASSAQQLFDIAQAFANQPLPKGNKTVIITNAGGPAALVSDSLSDNDFKLGNLQEETISYLRERLNPSAQVDNPIDMLGGATPKDYTTALEKIFLNEESDVVLTINVPTSLINPADIASAIASAASKTQKTILSCLMGEASVTLARKILHGHGVPMYNYPEQIGPVLGAMSWYREWLMTEPAEVEIIHGIKTELSKKIFIKNLGEKHWGEATVRPMLECYGIPVIPGRIAANELEAFHAGEDLGFPVVLKVISKDILHKSDAGGIRLNLRSREEIQVAYTQIMESCMRYRPEAKIDGVLVEKMAPKGIETIIGMRRDPQFGPLIMFGLGGIYVELFTDISFAVAPFSRIQAKNMIMETKAGKLLIGIRGQASADIDAVVETILRLSALACDFPDIAEIEINPFTVFQKGQGALALDARAILH